MLWRYQANKKKPKQKLLKIFKEEKKAKKNQKDH
jgi:hypothetical protein